MIKDKIVRSFSKRWYIWAAILGGWSLWLPYIIPPISYNIVELERTDATSMKLRIDYRKMLPMCRAMSQEQVVYYNKDRAIPVNVTRYVDGKIAPPVGTTGKTLPWLQSAIVIYVYQLPSDVDKYPGAYLQIRTAYSCNDYTQSNVTIGDIIIPPYKVVQVPPTVVPDQ